ncbi:MAG: PD-(D/E)XK nuclease family transposase [Oribacterium sp.]|nr:PD-(D/E)XK nuclease family transposase [Oribacterium sp.]
MEKEKININVKYKDRLFRLLFGREENKEAILSLYNALNNSDYKDVSELELYTIEDVIYIKMKNDVAFILESYLSLWEQQSTYNPNMPVRGLMYYAKMYDKYIKSRSLNIYGSKLIQIPTPRYIVFYNGTEEIDSIKQLKLSDSFIKPDKTGAFEWTATLCNLNKGKNDELRSQCKVLDGYMTLIERIRGNLKSTEDVEKAVDSAVVSCIDEGILRDFLIAHRAEVIDMCLTEYDEKTFVNGIKEEGREEGRKEGRKEGCKEQIIRQICRKLRKEKTVSQIAEDLEEDETKVKTIYDAAAKFAPDFDEEKVIRSVLKEF